MTIPASSSLSKQCGITLIEVLVAVLVLAIGLLGVAGLQSLSLRNTTTVHFEQKAQSYADDMINRIMANNSAADTGAYANNPPTAAPSTDCTAGSCTEAEMAAWDLWEWSQALTNDVDAPPAATAKIDWNAALEEYQIAISWDAANAGDGYTTTTCTDTDNSSAGCYFVVYRLR